MCEGTAEGVHAALGRAKHLGVLALQPTPEYMIPGHVEDDAARGLDVILNMSWDHVLGGDRKSTRLNSSHVSISYAVFCLKKKKTKISSYTSLTILLELV